MGTGALSAGGMSPTLAMSVTGVHLVHLTFALLLAFGLAGPDALDAFSYLARTDALSLLMVVVLLSVSALRLYVLSGDKRRLSAAIWLRGDRGAQRALSQSDSGSGLPYSLLPYLVAGWLVLVLGLTDAGRHAAARPASQRWRRA